MNEDLEVAANKLDRAADVLLFHGHKKGDFGTLTGPKCVIGALCFAITDGQTVEDDGTVNSFLLYACTDTLAAQVNGRDRHGVVEWNDHASTTAADVIDACRHAAKHLREELTTESVLQS